MKKENFLISCCLNKVVHTVYMLQSDNLQFSYYCFIKVCFRSNTFVQPLVYYGKNYLCLKKVLYILFIGHTQFGDKAMDTLVYTKQASLHFFNEAHNASTFLIFAYNIFSPIHFFLICTVLFISQCFYRYSLLSKQKQKSLLTMQPCRYIQSSTDALAWR